MCKTPYAPQQEENRSQVRAHPEALTHHCPSSLCHLSPFLSLSFSSSSFQHPLPPLKVQPAPLQLQSLVSPRTYLVSTGKQNTGISVIFYYSFTSVYVPLLMLPF